MFKKTLLFVLLTFGVALAQPLASLAPADTVLSLSQSYQGGLFDTLDDDFAALEWEAAGETLEKLLNAAAQLSDDADLEDMLEMYQDILESYRDPVAANEEVLEFCPAYADVIESSQAYMEQEDKDYTVDALLTVSISAFSPVPAGTALTRVNDDVVSLYTEMQETLLACAQENEDIEVTELDEGGVPLYVIGNASDFPIVAGSVDNLFFVGTNPEVMRGVVRRAGGSDEPNFAETTLYEQASGALGEAGNSLGLSLNLAALADTLEGYAGFIIDGPETEYLVDRVSAVLRTLGGVASQISATDEGLVGESVFAINREGGDEALLELVLCETCEVSAPFLAPEGTVAVQADYLPWRELWAYAQTWLRDVEEISGESLDVAELASSLLGVELDAELINWLGSESHTYTLETVGTDLRTLLYNTAAATVIPVSSPEAAQAAFEHLGETLEPFLAEFMGEMEPTGTDFADFFDTTAYLRNPVVTEETYKDTAITRVRAGLNVDFGYAFVGNYLVVGSPVGAVEQIIDTFEGGDSFGLESNYRAFRDTLPESVTRFRYQDVSASYRSFAELLNVFVQPAAFAAHSALVAAVNNPFADSNFDDFDDFGDFGELEGSLGYAYVEGVEPEMLGVPGTAEGTLEEDEIDASGFVTDVFELNGLTPGTTVEINLSSDAFDAYLLLIDVDQAIYIAENDDDGSSSDSALSFTVEEGRSYWVEVSSYDGFEVGDYTLSVETSGEMAETDTEDPTAEGDTNEGDSDDDTAEDTEVEPELTEDDLPTFAELLALFELLPQTFEVIAENTDTTEGYSVIQNDTVYLRSVTRVTW